MCDIRLSLTSSHVSLRNLENPDDPDDAALAAAMPELTSTL